VTLQNKEVRYWVLLCINTFPLLCSPAAGGTIASFSGSFFFLSSSALHDFVAYKLTAYLFCHRSKYNTLCFFHHGFFFLGFMVAITNPKERKNERKKVGDLLSISCATWKLSIG
jgi:hypothetical protein